jgi:hypothetical protein
MRPFAFLLFLTATACVLPRPDEVQFIDDNNTADDDDATAPEVPPDDDDAAGLPPCNGELSWYDETEPNNTQGTHNYVSGITGPLLISGHVAECGNNGGSYIGDREWFTLEYTCAMPQNPLAFQLDWDSRADIDFTATVIGSGAMLVGDSRGFDPPELGVLETEGAIATSEFYTVGILVACWNGEPNPWSLTVTPEG